MQCKERLASMGGLGGVLVFTVGSYGLWSGDVERMILRNSAATLVVSTINGERITFY